MDKSKPESSVAPALPEAVREQIAREARDCQASVTLALRIANIAWEAAAQQRELLRGAMAAQDEREAKAGERCGISALVHGCDWPDAVADALIASRQRVRELEAAAQQERAHFARFYDVANDFWALTHAKYEDWASSCRDLERELWVNHERYGFPVTLTIANRVASHPPPTPEDR